MRDSARSLHQPARARRFRQRVFGIGADRKNLNGAEFVSALTWRLREGRRSLATPAHFLVARSAFGSPFGSVALITRAHEAVKQRQEHLQVGLLMSRSSILVWVLASPT